MNFHSKKNQTFFCLLRQKTFGPIVFLSVSFAYASEYCLLFSASKTRRHNLEFAIQKRDKESEYES